MINIFLRASAENAIEIIESKTIFHHTLATNIFRDLDRRRAKIVNAAFEHGCDFAFAHDRSQVFFALEFLEQRYLRKSCLS